MGSKAIHTPCLETACVVDPLPSRRSKQTEFVDPRKQSHSAGVEHDQTGKKSTELNLLYHKSEGESLCMAVVTH